MGKKKKDIVKTMTIDGLATRFDGLETRFDGLETRFDGLETRFDGLGMTVDGLAIAVAKGFDDIREEIISRLDTLEHKVDATRSDISTLFFNEKKIKGRVENLESSVFGAIQEA
jgi:tetrahydromethanopterin S-methyltransferase subunit G